MRLLASLGLLALAASALPAATLTVSDFSSYLPDYTGGSWYHSDISDTTFLSGTTTLAVGNFGAGQPLDDGSFGTFLSSTSDWSGYVTVTLTGFAAGGSVANEALHLNFFVMDDSANSAITQFVLSDFGTGPGVVSVALSFSLDGIDATRVSEWGFGTNIVGSAPFAFTFDKLELSTTAIPEPASWAAGLGASALGGLLLRRRRRSA